MFAQEINQAFDAAIASLTEVAQANPMGAFVAMVVILVAITARA